MTDLDELVFPLIEILIKTYEEKTEINDKYIARLKNSRFSQLVVQDMKIENKNFSDFVKELKHLKENIKFAVHSVE